MYRQFLGLMAERYYALAKEVVRTYDPRGLILGDRYQSFYYPEVVRACAQPVDVVSGNLNAAWNDGTFPRYYLATLHALSGRPVGIYMNTRNVAALELPAERFGKARFKAGDTIDLASTFYTHARADVVEWKGRFTLRGRE